MLRSNYWGIGMFVVAGLLAGLGSVAFKLADAPVLIGVGASLILMDLLLRLRSRYVQRWLLNGEAGGYLLAIPVWIVGVVVVVANLLRTTIG